MVEYLPYRGFRPMKNTLALLWLSALVLLFGCNGSSGKNDAINQELPVATSISLSIENSQGVSGVSFNKNDSLTVTATVLDQFGVALLGQKVDFSSSIGNLSPSSKLTETGGKAVVTLTNDAQVINAGTITASTDSLTSSLFFEFINYDAPAEIASISSKLLLDNVSVNQFRTNQSIQISTKLVDSANQALAGQIIRYTADVGDLTTDSALTDANGVAVVSLTGGGAIGAGIITASYTNDNLIAVTNHLNYQVLAEHAIIEDNEIFIGYFDQNNQFIEGQIQLSIVDSKLSAGGTVGLQVALADSAGQRVLSPTPVNFSSNCVSSGRASIDETVFTVSGIAKATFEDINCAGTTGIDDVLLASININETSKTASTIIQISGEQLGAIEFVSASPSAIVLKGTGGQGKQETSTLTFLVKSALGNPVAQQAVDFSLSTNVGGISLHPESGLTNSQGYISTQVVAGTVPTAVRVNASAELTNDNQTVSVQSQSDLLSINTGLPEQRSMSLSSTELNVEADSFTGGTALITAWLADNFNNPVPDGTTVNFTTEGGVIQPSCNTQNGRCNVTWTAKEPRVADHRITILATALGHETFFDTNGNNTFDGQDGAAMVDLAASSGFERIAPQSSGFVDMTEAWRDDNENRQYDIGELFFDFDNNASFSSENGLFNGPQCQGDLCGTNRQTAIHVRKAMVLVMSGSQAEMILTNSANGSVLADTQGNGSGIPAIADGASLALNLSFSDLVNQPLPANSQISVTLSSGDLAGTTSYTMPKTNRAGKTNIAFVLSNVVGGTPETGTLTLKISTPNGIETSLVRTVQFQ
jgi:hypothetical protein